MAASSPNPPDDRSRASSLVINYLHLDADKVLSAYGKFGRYQMVTYLITNSVHILFAINMMVMPFITEDPVFECQITPPEGVKWVSTALVLGRYQAFFQPSKEKHLRCRIAIGWGVCRREHTYFTEAIFSASQQFTDSDRNGVQIICCMYAATSCAVAAPRNHYS
ncbi:hypothetical protein ANCCAN_24245 [Ancylostoma caninum]|uniref:Uncharacterized protein n=1 Tax=Ancylostoma caninum TaxID=29170 RepID=A0A368FCT9_ANCCA|nr:hypothetical protein ANCCAN_24245 [Ancylostoma caninum]